MLNRKNPVAISGPSSGPRWWPTISFEEKDSTNQTSLLPTSVKILENDSTSRAPKPPKKRFLESAVAHQLLLQQQQQQVQVEHHSGNKSEDNSALMQLAEMCVVYQKSGHANSLKYCWSPTATACKPVDSDMPHSSVSNSISPKAASPSWGWASGPVISEEYENEEPLDLSGERTIRANQQDLIDHIVEKLCSGNCRSASSDLKPIQLMSVLEIRACKEKLNSSSEVSSTIDHIKEVKADNKDIRKDLPLKKRDPAGLNQVPCNDHQTIVVACDSSTSQRAPSALELEPVSSSNNHLKPAQRSCKGKRYLEFMYEGRIPLGSRVKRMENSDTAEVSETTTSSIGGRKTRRKVKRPTDDSFSMRGRRARKFS